MTVSYLAGKSTTTVGLRSKKTLKIIPLSTLYMGDFPFLGGKPKYREHDQVVCFKYRNYWFHYKVSLSEFISEPEAFIHLFFYSKILQNNNFISVFNRNLLGIPLFIVILCLTAKLSM